MSNSEKLPSQNAFDLLRSKISSDQTIPIDMKSAFLKDLDSSDKAALKNLLESLFKEGANEAS